MGINRDRDLVWIRTSCWLLGENPAFGGAEHNPKIPVMRYLDQKRSETGAQAALPRQNNRPLPDGRTLSAHKLLNSEEHQKRLLSSAGGGCNVISLTPKKQPRSVGGPFPRGDVNDNKPGVKPTPLLAIVAAWYPRGADRSLGRPLPVPS